jgi:hypothetical protein
MRHYDSRLYSLKLSQIWGGGLRYHRQYNLLTYVISVFRSIMFFFLILLTNKQNLTSRCWLVCPELGNFRRYRSLLMLNVLFPVDFHHYIMARTDTTGCLNHQHDRRYCCHHCLWYLSAVYCLTSIAQLIVYHGSHPLAHVTSRNHVTT